MRFTNYGAITLPIDDDDDNDNENDNDDDDEWLLEEQLARQGLYRGDYRQLLWLYTVVPVASLVSLALFAALPVLAYANNQPSRYPYPPSLPYPLPELLTAIALWSLTHLSSDSLFTLSSSVFALLIPTSAPRIFQRVRPIFTPLLASLLQSTIAMLLRLLSISILLIPYYAFPAAPTFIKPHLWPTWHDSDAFRRIWWLALGWAAAEAIVAIKQGYESMALYKDVLVSARPQHSNLESGLASSSPTSSRAAQHTPGAASASARMDDDDASKGDHDAILTDDVNATPRPRLANNTNRDRQSPTRPTLSDPNGRTQYRAHSSSFGSQTSNPNEHHSHSPHRRRTDHTTYTITAPVEAGDQRPLPLLLGGHDLERSFTADSVQGGTGAMSLSWSLHMPRNESKSRKPGEQQDDDDDDEQVQKIIESAVERDLEDLANLKMREELEELYGVPVIRIPVFISTLHRINSILNSIGTYLLLGATYMRSPLSYHPPGSSSPSSLPFFPSAPSPTLPSPPPPTLTPLILTLLVLISIQTLLTGLLHTPWVLPRLGIHTLVYVSLLVALGVFFAGLGVWEALT